MPPNIWIDVEDLFEYARGNARPSGIQRVVYELGLALQALPSDGAVRFVRRGAGHGSYGTIGWDRVAALFAALAEPPVTAAPRTVANGGSRRGVSALLARLPPALRPSVTDAVRTHFRALKSWPPLLRALLGWAGERLGASRRSLNLRGDDAGFAHTVQPGDWLLLIGAPWALPDPAGWVAAARQRHKLRVATIIYDLTPIRFVEFIDPVASTNFREWCDPTLLMSDALFAISQATAADTARYLHELGRPTPPQVVALPMGTGFSTGRAHATRTARLPPPGSYALIVSTLSAHKNHLLLFRVWQRLLQELPAAQVPTLVFAGRPSYMVDDLMRAIANTNSLDGKLLHLADASDGEVAALFEGCRFTLFPSYAEGWGLPVSESLAFGKPCFAADRTSLPEAGMGLARLFDPDNLPELLSQLRHVLTDPDELAAWTAKVRAEFRPVPWSATAQALLDGLSGG